MARIRSVSPELRTSETCAAWDRETRYAWVLLWGYCDDYGRALDNLKVIAGDCFPLDDDVTPALMGKWLDTFEKAGAICRYEQDGKRYLHCTNWTEYQKPQHPGKVRIPPCPEHESAAHAVWSEAHARPSRKSHEGLMSVSPTRGRGSKELSKEEESREEGEPPQAVGKPPRFPDHCPTHANVAVPGNCGACKDTRLANAKALPRLSLVSGDPRPEWCGRCDEFTRQLETPVGVIRCPECHPLAEEASA
jgi:hypothetical protein